MRVNMLFRSWLKKIMFGSLLTTKEWFGRKRDLRIRQSNFILSVESNPEFFFLLFPSVIGSENSCLPLNQSDAKLTPTVSLSLTFSRASSSWLALKCTYILMCSFLFYFGFSFTTRNRKASYLELKCQRMSKFISIIASVIIFMQIYLQNSCDLFRVNSVKLMKCTWWNLLSWKGSCIPDWLEILKLLNWK